MKAAFPSLSIAALVATLSAPGLLAAPAAAQDMGATMGMALTMLELSAERELTRIGLDEVDVKSLTLQQLAAIRLATSTDEMDMTAQSAQVRRIVGEN